MNRADAIVAEARSWIGTPYLHQARVKGVGVDCVGLITRVSMAVCGTTYDITDYARAPDGKQLMEICRATLDPVQPFSAFAVGDAVVLQFGAMPHHMGFVGDYRWGGFSLIHAHSLSNPPRVLEHRLDTTGWGGRVIAAFRLRDAT